jgi:hypothetical protein
MSTIGKHLTNEDRQKIRKLHEAGESVLSIARLVGVSFNTAAKWARAESLPAETSFPEAAVLELLKQRVAQRQISRALKVPIREVARFARANGFGKPHWHPSSGIVISLIDMALSHRHSVAQISRTLRTPYDSTRKMVRTVLECERLISGGQGKWGLDSYFPSRHKSPLKPAQPKQEVLAAEQREESALFVIAAVRRVAGSAVPDDQLVEVAALTVTMIFQKANPSVPIGATEWKRIKTCLSPHFLAAIATLRNTENGPVN